MALEAGDFVGPLLGGLFNLETGKQSNKAIQNAARINADALRENQNRALTALKSSSASKTVKPDGSGGFIIDQPGEASAVDARSTLAAGDATIRAPKINDLSRNFRLSIPDLSTARGITAEESAARQKNVDFGLQEIIKARQRASGGIQAGGNFEASTVDALGRFAAENTLNNERGAIQLLQQSGANDAALLKALQEAFAMQAPAQGFDSSGPGGQAAAAVTQSPPTQLPADLGGAIPFATGGNIVEQIIAARNRREDQNALLEAIRHMGNAGSGVNIALPPRSTS